LFIDWVLNADSVLLVTSAGAFAVYLEPWHADVFDWLELRKNHGKVADHAFFTLAMCPSEHTVFKLLLCLTHEVFTCFAGRE
jgi:ribonucleotide reductase alpha subunit